MHARSSRRSSAPPAGTNKNRTPAITAARPGEDGGHYSNGLMELMEFKVNILDLLECCPHSTGYSHFPSEGGSGDAFSTEDHKASTPFILAEQT